MGMMTLIRQAVKKPLVQEPNQTKKPKKVKEPKEPKKPKKSKKAKEAKNRKHLAESVWFGMLHFFLAFFLSRTSLFFDMLGMAPFGGSVFLATGGSVAAYVGAVLGCYTVGSYDAIGALSICFLLKKMIRKERMWKITERTALTIRCCKRFCRKPLKTISEWL